MKEKMGLSGIERVGKKKVAGLRGSQLWSLLVGLERGHTFLIGPFPGHPSYLKLIFMGSYSFLPAFLLKKRREARNSPAVVEEENRIAEEFCLIIRALQVFQCFCISNSEYMLLFSPEAIL